MEKAILQKKPWFFYIEEQHTIPISSTIPSPAEILFGRKMRSNLSVLPLQLINDRIVYIREQIAQKEGRILTEERNSTVQLDLEQNSFLIETDNGMTYQRNRNFLKPRQVPSVPKNDYSNLDLSGKHSLPKASAGGPATTKPASLSSDRIPPLAKKSNSHERIGVTVRSSLMST